MSEFTTYQTLYLAILSIGSIIVPLIKLYFDNKK